jgi:hypothetical protein
MTRRARAVVLAAVAVAAVVAGCGDIALDESPRVVEPDRVPEALVAPTTSTTVDPSVGGVDADLYLFYSTGSDEVLLPCAVPTSAGGSVEARARAVLQRLIALDPLTSDECPDNLTNAVPSNLAVLEVRLLAEEQGNVLEVNLSRQTLGAIEATQQRRAIAQLVFTATDVPGVSAVRFFADGTAISVPVEDRTADPGEAIRPTDFANLKSAVDRWQALANLPTEPVEPNPVP